MPEQDAQLDGQSAVLLKRSLQSMRRAAWFAALPAFFAMLTTVNVYLGEARRSDFERMKYTQDAYVAYATFLESRRGSGGHAKCLDYLTDPKNVRDEEFIDLWQYKTSYTFQFDSSRHAGLKVCVSEVDVQTLMLFDKPTWQREDFERFRSELNVNHGYIIEKLDAALIGYPREVIDREIACENFAAFLTSGVAWVHRGILGKYIARAIDLKLVRKDNYPNIYEFEKDVAALTNNFESVDPPDCSKIPRKSKLQRFLRDLFG